MSEPIGAAAVVDGIVVNVEMIEPGYDRDGVLYVPSETAGIGDRYDAQTGVFERIETVATIATADVDAERDRRIDSGFVFRGDLFQTRQVDRENILGASSLAHMALTIGGKAPGDLRWHGGESDFVWIAVDNSLVTMDAPTVIAFGQGAAEHKSAHTFAARALKNADPIPADYADDRHWPAAGIAE